MIASYSYRDNKILFTVLVSLSIGTIILSNLFGTIIYVAIFGLISLISIFFISYRYPRYNILILLSCNYFVPLLIKAFMLYDVPFGIANEGLCALMLFTLILNKRISGIKTLPAVMLLIWMLYQLIELMNPYAFSRLAGFLALRTLIPFLCCFFIMYSSIDNKRDINLFFSGVLILSMCAGTYCLYQEFVGLPFYDFRWATQDEDIYNLLFTWGRLRKFSFFFNPSEFGMLMGVTGVVALVIFFFAKEKN